MKQPLLALLLILPSALIPTAAHAQATYTATRAGDLQLGGGVSLGSSNYNSPELGGTGESLRGYTLYGTFDFRYHFGAEVSFRNTTPTYGRSVYERTYQVGGRYVYPLHNRYNPYAKVLYGRGVFNYPETIANLAYNIGTVGAGLDYRLTRTLNLRADYEHQHWFGFPLAPLQPNIVTVGVAYHFASEARRR